MYIHDEKKLCYLAHPKTASISTAAALKHRGFRRFQSHHSKLYCKNSPVDDSWTSFTTVRNHYDIVISWTSYYASILGLETDDQYSLKTFEFALGEENPYATDRLFALHGDDADVICRYETLQEDIDRVLVDHGVKRIPIEQLNITPQRHGKHYSYFYTDETREYVWKRFRKEIEKYGYEFEKGENGWATTRTTS